MAATYKDNGGSVDGSNLEFTYDFPTIQTEDVKVSLNGATQATTKYTVSLSPAKITFNNSNVDSTVQESTGAPKTGVTVKVYRETTVGKIDGNEDPKAVFASGSSIRAIDLNNNQEQVLFGIHELQDQTDHEISLPDKVKIKLGNSNDAEIFYSPTYYSGKVAGTGIASALVVDADDNVFIDVTGAVETSTTLYNKFTTYHVGGNGTNGGENYINIGNSAASSDAITIKGHVRPSANNSYDLGTTSYKWKDLYAIAGTFTNLIASNIDGSIIGANTAAAGTFTEVNLLDDQKIKLGSSADDSSIYYDGSDLIAETNSVLVKTTGNQEFMVDGIVRFMINDGNDSIQTSWPIVPLQDDQHDLGTSSLEWRDLYIDGTAYLDTADIRSITGNAIVTTGTSPDDDKVYSAKHSDAIFLRQDSTETLASGVAWAANDTTVATTAAIDARVIGLVTDVGGFVPIANETVFPTTNRDPTDGDGTIISITALTADRTASAGTGSANTGVLTTGFETIDWGSVNNNQPVTITGCPNSQVFKAGYGLLVETTSTLNTYTFVRYVADTSSVVTVAGKADEIELLGTAAAVEDLGILGTTATVSDLATLADISDDITTVAHIEDGTHATDAVQAVAGVSSDVTTCADNIIAIQGASGNATTATTKASEAATSAATATTKATTATTKASEAESHAAYSLSYRNAAQTAQSAAEVAQGGAVTAKNAAETAETGAVNAKTAAETAETNAASHETDSASYAATSAASATTAEAHKVATAGIYTQSESAAFNVNSNQDWGTITDAGTNVFANETTNTLLTMSEGSSTYDYASIT